VCLIDIDIKGNFDINIVAIRGFFVFFSSRFFVGFLGSFFVGFSGRFFLGFSGRFFVGFSGSFFSGSIFTSFISTFTFTSRGFLVVSSTDRDIIKSSLIEWLSSSVVSLSVLEVAVSPAVALESVELILTD